MEGRVLLSGNTLDLSTFGTDLTAASYGPPVVVRALDSTASSLPSGSSFYVSTPASSQANGGFIEFDNVNQAPIVNSSDFVGDHSVSVAGIILTVKNVGLGISGGYNGAFDLNDNLNSTGTLPALGRDTVFTNSVGQAGNSFDYNYSVDLRSDAELKVWSSSFTPRTITPVWEVYRESNAVVISEGGSIFVSEIRTGLAQESIAQQPLRSVASAIGDSPGNASESRGTAVTQSAVSAPIDGEWTRAVAMESVGNAGSVTPADRRSSREAAPETPIIVRELGPLSSNELPTHARDGHTAVLSATEPTDGVVDRLTVFSLRLEGGSEPLVTPVAFTSATSTAAVSDVGRGVMPVHRVDGRGRTSSGVFTGPLSASELARDEAYSQWRLSLPEDAKADSSELGEHRLWVNPTPFLVVLALERFVALEPREERGRVVLRESHKPAR
jgi:hypothetical protein